MFFLNWLAELLFGREAVEKARQRKAPRRRTRR
jgi:hypothetical protein